MQDLEGETFSIALLDSGCTKTVSGEKWFKVFIDILSSKDAPSIITIPSDALIRFGNSKIVKANKSVKIPVTIAGTPVMLFTDIIKYEIPLLLSKEVMKRAHAQIDVYDDKVCIF